MGMLIRKKNVHTLSYLQNAINHTSVYLLVCSESAAILIYTFLQGSLLLCGVTKNQ